MGEGRRPVDWRPPPSVAISRPSLGHLSATCRPPLGHLSAISRPSLGCTLRATKNGPAKTEGAYRKVPGRFQERARKGPAETEGASVALMTVGPPNLGAISRHLGQSRRRGRDRRRRRRRRSSFRASPSTASGRRTVAATGSYVLKSALLGGGRSRAESSERRVQRGADTGGIPPEYKSADVRF